MFRISAYRQRDGFIHLFYMPACPECAVESPALQRLDLFLHGGGKRNNAFERNVQIVLVHTPVFAKSPEQRSTTPCSISAP